MNPRAVARTGLAIPGGSQAECAYLPVRLSVDNLGPPGSPAVEGERIGTLKISEAAIKWRKAYARGWSYDIPVDQLNELFEAYTGDE